MRTAGPIKLILVFVFRNPGKVYTERKYVKKTNFGVRRYEVRRVSASLKYKFNIPIPICNNKLLSLSYVLNKYILIIIL